jgi:Mn-dependent DtxR family transcriptional regulator
MKDAKQLSHVWREFEANEVTHSGAHYLLAIGALAREGTPPRAADIARHLGVSRAAVSLQLRILAGHRLVRAAADSRIHLTRAGADLVARIAGKREVVLRLLRDVLGVPAHRAELDACKVEHLLSEETGGALVRLIRFLDSGHPSARSFLEAYRTTIGECPPGDRCEFCERECLLRAGEHR